VLQTTRDRSNFGKGEIRGVIAPESANNACQGGALIPTLLFGIPGSGSMAVFLGGMILIGIQPGVTMVDTRLDLTYAIIWSLALANVFGAGICALLARQVARLTTLPFVYLAPFMIMIVLFAAYQATRSVADLVALVAMGILGVHLRRFGWPRPALLIGFVLAPGTETYLYQAVQFYDWAWLLRPGVLIILAITVLSVVLGIRYEASVSTEGAAEAEAVRTRTAQAIFAAVVALILAYAVVDSLQLNFLGRVFPLTMAVVTGLAAIWVLIRILRGGEMAWHDEDAAIATAGGFWTGREAYLAMIAAVVLGVYVFGFMAGMAIFFLAFLLTVAKSSPARAVVLTASALGFMFALSWAMTLHLPEGLVPEMISDVIAG
jgi:hypothetical protein